PFFASSFYDLVIAVSIFGIGGGISMPAIMAYAVIKGDTKKAMGSVISILTVAHSMGMLTGSIVAGLAMDYLSLRLSFPCGTIIMALGTFSFFISCHKNTRQRKF
ncbi:MAG: MFS transporter, partial [Desulfobacula sp.]|nr:MFS transporter [Desulfobacula sp.]